MPIQNKQFENWAKNQKCEVNILIPKSTKELMQMLEKAKKEKITIRAYGSGHSWSDIICGTQYLVDTSKLNKIISFDEKRKQVRVQAGIKIEDLNKKLHKLNLCLSNQGAITKQSLAGVVSTATHGSGKTGTFASFVTEIQLLTAQGKLLNISKTENEQFFSAVRTSFGELGIMTELTIQCEELFKLYKLEKNITWNEYLQLYSNLLEKADYVEFFWNVDDDSVDVKINNRLDNLNFGNNSEIETSIKKADYSYKMLSGELNVIYMEEEIAIPRINFTRAAKAARQLLKNYKKRAMFGGILFRFVSKENNNLLSPASDSDVVYFSITTSSKTGYEDFFKKFYALMLKYNGRPHWGKINYLNKSDTKKLYGKNYEAFVKAKKQLDPNGLHSNQFTKRIFG